MAPLAELDVASMTTDSGDTAEEETESKWRLAFDAVVKRILKDYEGQDKAVRDGMETGMRRLFTSPYREELGGLSLEEAQRVIFYPTLGDMKRYVEVFSRETPQKTKRKEQLMKFKLMSVFYTLHRADSVLVDRFVHYGGLQSLVSLLFEENRVIQSQAIELLADFLSPALQIRQANSCKQAHLQHQVFVCFRNKHFWHSLARIMAEPHEIFPKSHQQALRLVACAIAWLKPEVPSSLPEPQPPPGQKEMLQAMDTFLSGQGYRAATPDTRGLAEDIVDDLRNGTSCRLDPASPEDLKEAEEVLFGRESEAEEEVAHTWQSLRQLGNDAFKAGLLVPAEGAYRLALSEGGAMIPAGEVSLLESNRALVLLKVGQQVDAAKAAAAALASDPTNAKAAYRRAMAMVDIVSAALLIGDLTKAASDAKEALAAAELAAKLEPTDVKVADLLSKVQDTMRSASAVVAQAQKGKTEALDSMD